jgi:hypothetical protein
MKAVLRFSALVAIALSIAAGGQPESNVNSRYTVESVELPEKYEPKLSDALRGEIRKLIGERFNPDIVDNLTRRIRKELRGYRVMHKVTKGAKPESIRVVFEIVRSRGDSDIVLPRLVYHSKQNFSFGADATLDHAGHRLSFGILTDNDELPERYSGIRGGYQRVAAGGRFRGGFVVESFRAQWNPAIQPALTAQPENRSDTVPGIYRTRLHVEPGFQLEVIPGVTVGAGVSIQRFQTQFPAARDESSHALTSSLRIERRWDLPVHGLHIVEAGYNLRAATQSLDSDFIYTRHAFHGRYQFRKGKESISGTFTGGALAGRAPLFERFVLGNSATLRGYNKYDVAPLGGNRMAHGSIDYRHAWFRVIYDTGAVYNRGAVSKLRHSIAAGITSGWKRDSFSFLVAFPLKEGRAEPVFILGMNF